MNHYFRNLLSSYLENLSQSGLSGSTKRTYASLVRQFIYFVEEQPQEATIGMERLSETAQQFLALQVDGKASSINTRASAIRHFLNDAGVQCEALERSKTLLTTREPLTDEQLIRFLQAAQRFPLRDRTIVYLLMETGIRLKECFVLSMHHVTIDDRRNLFLSCSRSGDVSQVLSLSEETHRLCKQYFELRKMQSFAVSDEFGQPLFVDKGGYRLSKRGLAAVVRKVGWAARIVVTPANLRLNRLMEMVNSGENVRSLTNLAGYSSTESARRIIRACENDLRRTPIPVRTAVSVCTNASFEPTQWPR